MDYLITDLIGYRQQLYLPQEFEKYSFIKEMHKLWDLFANDSIEQNAKYIKLHNSSKYITCSMQQGMNKDINQYISYIDTSHEVYSSKTDDKSVVVCISGGKDSLAAVYKFLDEGYNVRLFTCKGINKGYPEEYLSAVKIAEVLSLPIYICNVKLSGKKYYMEHPLKNQIICSCAMAWCLENDIPCNISFGCFKEDTNINSNWGVNWTDNYELWNAFYSFIKCYIKKSNIIIPLDNESEAISEIIKRKDLIGISQSCLMTVRNRNQLREINQKKYNIKLMDNRCGSCRKCCMEYIYCADNNISEYNESFYIHCLKILKNKYSEYQDGMPHFFKNYGEVYEAYFNKSFLESAFFKNNNGELNV